MVFWETSHILTHFTDCNSGHENVRDAGGSFTKQVSDLQETTGVILLDDLQAVLHQPCGLTQLHRTVGDLIPNHLGNTEG